MQTCVDWQHTKLFGLCLILHSYHGHQAFPEQIQYRREHGAFQVKSANAQATSREESHPPHRVRTITVCTVLTSYFMSATSSYSTVECKYLKFMDVNVQYNFFQLIREEDVVDWLTDNRLPLLHDSCIYLQYRLAKSLSDVSKERVSEEWFSIMPWGDITISTDGLSI